MTQAQKYAAAMRKSAQGAITDKAVRITLPHLAYPDERTQLLLCEDGSGFFSTKLTNVIDYGIDKEDFITINVEDIPADIMQQMSRPAIDYRWQDAPPAFLKAIARAASDAPEGLLPYLVDTDCEVTWRDAASEHKSLAILQIAAQTFCSEPASIVIYTENAKGRTLHQQNTEHAYLADYDPDAQPHSIASKMYHGQAYVMLASFMVETQISDKVAALEKPVIDNLNEALTIVSDMVFEKYGTPKGWIRSDTYQRRTRASSYIADARRIECEHLDLTPHQQIDAIREMNALIAASPLQTALQEILAKTDIFDA